MSGATRRDEREGTGEEASDEGLLSTVDAGGAGEAGHVGGSSAGDAFITPDPFLAEVARVPARGADGPASGMPRPGDTIGRFTVLSELGRGGMGVVYSAEDRTLGREVALKVLPTSGEERRRRFLREARSAAALTHPGVATIYDVGEADGRVFIAMELVHGVTLRSTLDARPKDDRALAVAEATRIGREIARALGKAHARGVVHRDLKPENVMIDTSDGEGRVKLLDFGLAKNCDALVERVSGVITTEDGRVVGTPSYMSPEQAKGRPVDARSDVFSFGVMLYELSTGVRPFPGASTIEVFIALDRDEPIPPSTRNPRVSPALETVILRCLAKDPAARYADAQALQADLEVVTAPASGRAGVSSPPRPAPRGPRWQLPAAGVGFLCLLGLAATSGRSHGGVLGATPVPMTALPTPRSSNAAAVVAYKDALAAFRTGGDWDEGFLRAIELDPNLAAAHVQVAAIGMFGAQEEARTHFRKAEALASSLDDRDRALLDAVEPVVRRQPSDWAETKRRLASVIDRYPGDAQLWYLLAVGAANFDDFEGAVMLLEKAVDLDPGFGHAWSFMSLALAYLGRFDDAKCVVDRCLVVNPGAEGCLEMQAHLQVDQGECEAMEATARQIIASGVRPRAGFGLLASALAARGMPAATIREALRQADASLATMPAANAAEHRRELDRALGYTSILEGDFEAAERVARSEAAAAASSRAQTAHGGPADVLAAILEETGRSAEAAAVAIDFLDRRDAWEPEASAEDMALASDVTPWLLRVAARGGRLTPAELLARRDPWLRTWNARVTPVSRNFLWMYAYAAVVDSPESARAALDALPTYGPLPPFRPATLVDVDVGRTYLLAGRVDEALPWLQHATRTCSVLRFPFAHLRGEVLLGRALEAKGDRAGACAAYASVVRRWGGAKPRSVTAEDAAARASALKCNG